MKVFAIIIIALVGVSSGTTEPLYSQFGIPTSAVNRGIDHLGKMESVFVKAFGKEDRLRKTAMAIVFPEVIRYEQSIDHIQVGLDKVKINGSVVFDFSIGLFQIKPKFVEELRKVGIEKGVFGIDALPSDLGQIVEMLETEKGSVSIIKLFIDVLLFQNSGLRNLPVNKVTRLLSTAYTFGFFENLEELDDASKIPTWHCLGMIGYNKVPYSEVALLYLVKTANEH